MKEKTNKHANFRVGVQYPLNDKVMKMFHKYRVIQKSQHVFYMNFALLHPV